MNGEIISLETADKLADIEKMKEKILNETTSFCE